MVVLKAVRNLVLCSPLHDYSNAEVKPYMLFKQMALCLSQIIYAYEALLKHCHSFPPTPTKQQLKSFAQNEIIFNAANLNGFS